MQANFRTRWLSVTIALDISLTIVALLLARWMREYFPSGTYFDLAETFSFEFLEEPLFFSLKLLVPVVVIVWLTVFSSLSIYSARFSLSQYNQVQPVVVAVTGSVLVFAGVAYFFFRDLSRFLFFYFYVADMLFLVGWRKVVFFFLKEDVLASWRPRHRVVIVGQGDLAQDVAVAIKTFAWSGLELLGFVGDESDALGAMADLPALVRSERVDEVIFALPPGHQAQLQQMVVQLQPLSVNMRLVPDVIDLVFVRATIEDFAGLPLIGLREPAINIFDRLIKRAFDIVVASLLLIVSLPFALVVIGLIKLTSKGSVFYTSQRMGEGGRIFNMVKFRTMVADADQQEADLLAADASTLAVNKQPNDPRVTPIGRFLRRISMDELPQLFNVIKGDMSLVGPRPELPWLVDRYEPWQYQRFTVPQGMTGWWQVKNRANQQEYNVRVEDDLYYIHNYSFLLDLRILFLTMGAIIRGDGAY